MQETVNERIKLIAEKLYKNNVNELCRALNIKQATMSNIVAGRMSKPSFEVLSSIIEKSNISAEWLITGKGDMLKTTETFDVVKTNGLAVTSEEEYQEAIEQGLTLLPEVNFKFAAGQTELVTSTEDITRYWYLPDCRDCKGVAQVIGNSMSPTLPSGCWVALKKYTLPKDNPNTIPFGNIFGIVVEDKITGEYHGHIKVLRRYKEQTLSCKYWIAHSINTEEFDDFDIEIAQVRSLWIVKQHIVSDMLL